MYRTLPYSMLVWPLPAPPQIDIPPEPSLGALPAPGDYRIDPGASSVGFTVRELGAVAVRGRFTGVTGALRVTRWGEDSTVNAEVTVTTLRTGRGRRDADLLGPRFLDAAAHPVLRFTGTRLGVDWGAWTVAGQLTVRGTTRPVTLRLDPARRTADGTVVLTAAAEVDRRDFGIRVPRALIGRRVRIDIDVTARIE